MVLVTEQTLLQVNETRKCATADHYTETSSRLCWLMLHRSSEYGYTSQYQAITELEHLYTQYQTLNAAFLKAKTDMTAMSALRCRKYLFYLMLKPHNVEKIFENQKGLSQPTARAKHRYLYQQQ